MSERKVLNKYYPPDFDPSKIPRMKLAKNRQYTVRLMAPFNMRCATCGEYIYKGKKFNARKEDVENQDYLGIRIYRFYIKCTRCLQEISFKTDPKNTDYEIEAGATRNFMALKLAEEQAKQYRTEQSRQEIELLESLEELKELNRRQRAVDYEGMLQQSIKFGGTSSQKVVAEEIIEEVEEDVEPPAKTSRIEVIPPKPDTKKNETWNRSIGVLSKKSALANLVKSKKSEVSKNTVTNTCEVTSIGMDVSKSTVTSTPEVTNESVSAKSSETVVAAPASGLTLLANYSGSDSDSQ
ncbi:hypothetical protein MSG28_001505 [Choristoneura fumiferana]|uniref:Uncharacterized protein n=1 Tax=Choristoneura fumiferana TaxID=7141 RepID=A0ACC0KUE5_CHOFU|nr:hypothetical protein MSG28_001505 [Choristoneura fumiferana]